MTSVIFDFRATFRQEIPTVLKDLQTTLGAEISVTNLSLYEPAASEKKKTSAIFAELLL